MVKPQEIVKYTLKILTLLALLVLFIYFFLKDQLESFIKSRTTLTSRIVENSAEIEFPTLTLCFLPATKISVTKKYGFQNDNQKFYVEIPNSSLTQRLDELTYQINRDFQVQNIHGKKLDLGLEEIPEKDGLKKQFRFEFRQIRTYSHGTCYQLIPKFNVDRAPLRIRLRLVLNSNLTDLPNSAKLQFTSNQSWVGILDDFWPRFKPLREIIHFSGEYTFFNLRIIEKQFQTGESNFDQCVQNSLSKRNCSVICSLFSFAGFANCQTVDQFSCMWKGVWENSEYTQCYKANTVTTYNLQERMDFPLHSEINSSVTDFTYGLWTLDKEIQEEVPILTWPDLIGSIGGSLGMFFGFCISAVIFHCIDKLLPA